MVDLYLQAIVMGIVQGLTEFLPVSSSGHLILVPALAGWRDPFLDSLPYTVMLHLGTLVALLVYFRREWIQLVRAGVRSLVERSLAEDPNRRLAWLLVVTAVPGALAGVVLSDTVEGHVRQPGVVALLFVVGAGLLWFADRWGAKTRPLEALTFRDALGIGVAQAFALLPGLSRSGVTIAAALALGLEREAAARFSFLMAAPIIAGAGIWEGRRLLAGGVGGGEPGLLVAGMAAALLSGLVAIGFLLRYLRTRSTLVFVLYRLAVAAVVVVAFLNP